MSWEPYALEITKDGKCYAAGVYGLDGSVWGVTNMTLSTHEAEIDNLETGNKDKVTVNEQALMVECSQTLGDMKSTVGLWMSGEKWQVITNNEVANSVYVRNSAKGGCITTTGQCIIVGLYDSNLTDTAGGKQSGGNTNVWAV